MGDRASISFVNGKDESVVMFSHWGGMDFVHSAKEYVKELRKVIADDKKKGGYLSAGPTGRMEPDTIMVDFIRWFTKSMDTIDGNYYLGATSSDGDNSDNGHFKINLGKKL